MILGKNISNVYSNDRAILKVFSNGKLVWETGYIDYKKIPFTVAAIDDNVTVELLNKANKTPTFKYSINGELWKSGSDNIIKLKKYDRVRIKSIEIYKCKITGLSDVFGNIMTLARYDIPQGDYDIYLENERFENFFSGSDIRSAENLILPEILSWKCCSRMFYNCTSLIKAPELPVTKLKGDCYEYMFYNCTSLIKAPELPATTLASYCYRYMFYNCTSLIKAPELPATTLAEGCYDKMFRYCNKLNYIKCYAKYNLEFISSKWTEGVSPTGILVCEEDVAPTLKSTVPDGWNIEYI